MCSAGPPGTQKTSVATKMAEEHRDRLVVILAGYRDRMDALFAVNPGLRSRIAGGTVDRDVLELIEPADLLGSTVFDDVAVAEP